MQRAIDSTTGVRLYHCPEDCKAPKGRALLQSREGSYYFCPACDNYVGSGREVTLGRPRTEAA